MNITDSYAYYDNNYAYNDTIDSHSSFSTVKDFTDYLYASYSTYREGNITISKSYLRKCMVDQDERMKLEKNLEESEQTILNAEENEKGTISTNIHINDDGEMETRKVSGVVRVNKGKREAQISASLTSADINLVMSMLAKDLSDCENGLKKGFCDDSEVQKVKVMIALAQKRQIQIATIEKLENGGGKNPPDKVTINLVV